MSERESEFLKELKLTILRGIVGFIGVIIIGATAFYFTTNNRLQNLESKTDVLSTNKADKVVVDIELSNIKGSLDRIETKLNTKQ